MLQEHPLYAYIPAKDLARARKFYEGTLGFKPKRENPGGIEYDCASGTRAFLYPTPHAGTNQASQAYWHVKDLEREVAELRSKGIVFEEYDMPGMKNGIVSHAGGKAAWFKDTEGNILALIQGA
ncbi:MAG TPA: VOC family protein [Myxococcales bacterium]|nr:VOC family protein [Myxococcales bacterium]